MPDRVLLTDRRKELLSGDYNADDTADRKAKSRLNSSASIALNELTQIADSPLIDHTDVFEPEDVHQFLRALLTGSHPDHTETGGLVPKPEEEDEPNPEDEELGDHHVVDYSQEFKNYQNAIRANFGKLIVGDLTESGE